MKRAQTVRQFLKMADDVGSVQKPELAPLAMPVPVVIHQEPAWESLPVQMAQAEALDPIDQASLVMALARAQDVLLLY